MGHGMAKNIALKMGESSKLYVYDINQTAVDTFVMEYGQNGRVASVGSPREIAEKCVSHVLCPDERTPQLRGLNVNVIFFLFSKDVVMTSVPKASHVEAVFLDPTTGLLAARTRGNTLFLELSTIDAGASSAIRDKVTAEGFGSFVDAPCSVCDPGVTDDPRSFMAN